VQLRTVGHQTFRAAGFRLWNSLYRPTSDYQTVVVPPTTEAFIRQLMSSK